MLEAGEADGTFMSSYREERLRYGVYPMKDGKPDESRKLVDLSYWLYVREGSEIGWDGRTISNLHRPIGATTGYAVVGILEEMGLAVEVDPSHLRNLRKLVGRQIDAYAELEAHVDALLDADARAFPTVAKLPRPLSTTPYYLMFSKTFYAAHPDLAERFWDAIAWTNASVEFKALAREKYAE
jgi:polar amino acid transport system substrate-binding protein